MPSRTAATSTPAKLESFITSGGIVVVRDEEWLVRSVQHTPADGLKVTCTGVSSFVRDVEATFFTRLDLIEPLDPADTQLVVDDTPGYRRSRLFLEAVIRKTPVPATSTDLTVAGEQLLDRLEYQRRAAHKALEGLRPRLLVADAVGLGKTLEVGLMLSELIRRGRGDRILVVTPRHILEQFQHELWTRFAIPLVRLDSEGIQRVRQKIPANRNPFSYYKRAIISIDTLKNAGRYRHHLEDISWDAVVIDECHSLVNRGTLNNQLARVLAPNTEALILTSATPHNGDPDSFAELVRLLDPSAVTDAKDLQQKDIEHLYIRRHKDSGEVGPEVDHKWADRLPPRAVAVTPSPVEARLFDELADVWTHPQDGAAPVTGEGRRLFPWTLFKAAMSSHKALSETVRRRMRNLEAADGSVPADSAKEHTALGRLQALADAVDDDQATKLRALLEQLQEIGVGPRSSTRVVVFSERIDTLNWLADKVPAALGLTADNVRVLHGGMADTNQMDVIEEFGLAESKVRLLLTGDMASEGVNLHRQCHHLVHFDLPWSLITIEQRNGRIDRYGQEHPPDMRALVVTPEHPRLNGDVKVLSKLLEREAQAHKAFGEAGVLLGLSSAGAEEEAIMRALADGVPADEVVPEAPERAFDLTAILGGGTGEGQVPDAPPPSLFGSVHAFVGEALDFAFPDPTVLDLQRDPADPYFLSFAPPADLVRRLSALPQSYLAEQKVAERLAITADQHVANQQLALARERSASSWPTVGHLSPLHPVVEWLVDKVLVGLGRNTAPVLVANVDAPTFCVQGLWSNGRGRPQLVEWMAVRLGDDGAQVDDLFPVLAAAGVAPGMPNPGGDPVTGRLQALVPAAVQAAKDELSVRRAARDAEVEDLLEGPRARLQAWGQRSRQLAAGADEVRKRQRIKYTAQVERSMTGLIESLQTTGDPMVRVLTVLVPAGGGVA